MPADKELIESIVAQVIRQLSGTVQPLEHVMIIGSEDEAGADVFADGVKRAISYSDGPPSGTKIDRYVLPLLEVGDMADLVMGKGTSASGKKVLELLLTGKTVEVLEYEYLRYEDSAPLPLVKLYRDYAETLTGFGLRPVKTTKKRTQLTQRVISEKDIEAADRQGVKEIGVASGALITSLADETARKLGIEILRDQRGA